MLLSLLGRHDIFVTLRLSIPFEAVIKKRMQVPCDEMKEALSHSLPAATDGGDGFEAARGKLAGARVAAIHSPVEEVDLVCVQLQEQDDNFAAQLVDLRQCRAESAEKAMLSDF